MEFEIFDKLPGITSEQSSSSFTTLIMPVMSPSVPLQSDGTEFPNASCACSGREAQRRVAVPTVSRVLRWVAFLAMGPVLGPIRISAQDTDRGGADWTPGPGEYYGRHYNIGRV